MIVCVCVRACVPPCVHVCDVYVFQHTYVFSPAMANRFAANFQFVEAVTKFTEAINMYPLDNRCVGVSMSVGRCVILLFSLSFAIVDITATDRSVMNI